MMSGNRLAAVLLLCTVALAGCTVSTGDGDPDTNQTDNQTQPTVTITPNDGLTMSLGSETPTYMEGEEIVLQLDLQNTGQKAASQIETELQGASFLVGKEPFFSGKTTLAAADQSAGRDGESTEVVWQIANPVDLDEGIRQSFPVTTLVKYKYATTARGTFTAVSRSNFDGQTSPISATNTAGPVKIEADFESPKRVTSSDGERTRVQIPIVVTNEGDGVVADIDGTAQDIEILRATFPNTDRATLDCPNQEFKLFDDRRRMICTAELPSDVYQEQLTFRIDLLYPYFETVESSFQVEGLPGDQSQ